MAMTGRSSLEFAWNGDGIADQSYSCHFFFTIQYDGRFKSFCVSKTSFSPHLINQIEITRASCESQYVSLFMLNAQKLSIIFSSINAHTILASSNSKSWFRIVNCEFFKVAHWPHKKFMNVNIWFFFFSF